MTDDREEPATRLDDGRTSLLASIVDSSDDAIISKTPDGIITSWNRGAERIYGYRADEIVGRPISVLIDPIRPDEMEDILGQIRAGRRIEHYETVRVRKDGRTIAISLTVSPILDGSGRLIGVSSIARDITERRRAEEDLRQASAWLADTQRAVLNILEDAAGEKGRLEEAQRAVLNILEDAATEKQRLEETQRAALNVLDDFASEKDRLEDTQRAALNVLDDFAAEKQRLEEAQRAVLNILDDFDLEKVKVEAANRELVREIGERREAERALVDKSDALRRSNEDLEQFAYVASHDLQEPLRMVASYVQLLARRYQARLDPQADRYIRYAVDGAQRMQALINALLEYSRVGRQTRRRPLDMNEVLDLALTNLEGAIADSGAEVTRGPLPSIVGDPAQLLQVLQNLVGNAIKFQRPDERPRVHVSAERRDGEIVFSVADNGIGIEPDQAGRLFVIFQRLHTRAEYPGTGIGLAICKKVIEHHGGRIWVESERGSGSTFRFALPARSGP